jgi:hypothetical protein
MGFNTKILAFHLPQFHTIPENDEWWGKGFTEWTNTKKAKPLFKSHHQPRTPKDDNYYDLSDLRSLSWQMDLANQYGLDGFCYYHYWFNGKLLLEKPLDLMRDLPNRIPYCFCWANEPWIRSWEGSSKVLMEQTYTGKADWQAHFEYLKRFFLDEKYIKIDNKPVFVLYKTKSIDDCEDMIAFWDDSCKALGFSGIYIIEEVNGFQNSIECSNSSAYLEFEPLYTIKFSRNLLDKTQDYLSRKFFDITHNSSNLIYSYDKTWHNIIKRKRKSIEDKNVCLGAFVDWDNTARKGKKSTIFTGATPEKFEKYMIKQISNAKQLNSPFVFINAWNEWGEGTYLEPDNLSGFKYLEALKNISSCCKSQSK